MSIASNAFALLDDHHTDHHGDAPKKKRKSKSHKVKPITNGINNVCSREQQSETKDTTDGITLTANSSNPSTSHADISSDQDVIACLQPVSSVDTNGIPHTGQEDGASCPTAFLSCAGDTATTTATASSSPPKQQPQSSPHIGPDAATAASTPRKQQQQPHPTTPEPSPSRRAALRPPPLQGDSPHGVPSGEEAPGSGAPPNSSFGRYLWAELNPKTAAPPCVLRHGLVERQRVYNSMMFIPYQLERLLFYGLLVCLDSFLAVFTVLPVRFACALAAALRSLVPRAKSGTEDVGGGGLQGDQLFDLLCVLIFGATVAFLRLLPAGTIYFWLKDLTQEFLKLHVIHSAVEIFDKIACSFVVDALEALSGTCGLVLSISGRRWHIVQLAADLAVALALILFHATVLICQFMTFSVAMNSKRSNAIIALLIASNFVEIKGTIFKRFDPAKLFVLVGQDVTERFHLLLSLCFVVVEEMDSSGSLNPSRQLLWRCCYIFGAEILIDVTKHAVLAKLNDIRPNVYQRFMKDVCEKAKGGQSHTAHRVVAFEPYAPAALFLRIAITVLVIRSNHMAPAGLSAGNVAFLGALCTAVWVALFAIKAVLGFSLRGIAVHFLQRHAKT